MRPTLVAAALLLSGCPSPSSLHTDAGSDDDAGAFNAVDAGQHLAGLELMRRLSGLWSGPASQTPLGTFPLMNVDFRGVAGRWVFGQADLDSANNLRFGFSIEQPNAARPVLSYRNGGYFQGVLRDSRTALISADDDAGTYRFCSVTQGCGYLDATFAFTDEQNLVFDVKVKGVNHVHWPAQRKETRPEPTPLPLDEASVGDGTEPWPALGALTVDASWPAPLTAEAQVWVLLSTVPCLPSFQCTISRAIRVAAPVGATSAQAQLKAVHPGAYKMMTVVDRNEDLGTTAVANSGDGVSVDQDLTVASTGETTAAVSVLYTVP